MHDTASGTGLRIRELARLAPQDIAALARLLAECIEGGASVGFVLPATPAKMDAFWRRVDATLERGARRLIVAEDARGEMLGSVQLVEPSSENQPHRADVAKMLVRPSARRRGVGAALLAAVESLARRLGKTLLVLDTATPEADRLYARHGWTLVGEVPEYALFPDGRPCATRFYYQKIA